MAEAPIVIRTPCEEAGANEAISVFLDWIPSLPALQRRVARTLVCHQGDLTNREICDEIAMTEQRPKLSSVKSARKEIARKFKIVLQGPGALPHPIPASVVRAAAP